MSHSWTCQLDILYSKASRPILSSDGPSMVTGPYRTALLSAPGRIFSNMLSLPKFECIGLLVVFSAVCQSWMQVIEDAIPLNVILSNMELVPYVIPYDILPSVASGDLPLSG